ncbi:MAG: nucleotidyl transferase AbiEii/AbiGii toxin family protein [Clostridia bacterium]|nr:nucleotidyl transferase AbiEii/AbiGii toxin family protein [Clostridia bacterium]
MTDIDFNELIAYLKNYEDPNLKYSGMSLSKYTKAFAKKTGFDRQTVEKEMRLIKMLDIIFSKWGDKIVLKGGTAINLFVQPLPRLSVDIDLDYIGSIDQSEEDVASDIFKLSHDLDDALKDDFVRSGKRREVPEASFISLSYVYENMNGNEDYIKVEIKYDDRALLMPVKVSDLEHLGYRSKTKISLMDEYQLYAGKIAALFRRATPRDLFDVYEFIRTSAGRFDRDLLRQCIIFDDCVSDRYVVQNLNFSNIESISQNDIKKGLKPYVEKNSAFDYNEAIGTVKTYLKSLLAIKDSEKEFIQKYKNHYYDPTLLFDSADIAVRAGWHPGAYNHCENTWVSKEESAVMAKALQHCGEYKIQGMNAIDLFRAAKNRHRKDYAFYKLFYGCGVSGIKEQDEKLLISYLAAESSDCDVIYNVFKCSALFDKNQSLGYYRDIIKSEIVRNNPSMDRASHSQIVYEDMDNAGKSTGPYNGKDLL